MKNLGFTKVIIESDAQQLIQVLHNSDRNYSYFDTLVDNCEILSKDLHECSFVFTKKINESCSSCSRKNCKFYD